MNEKKPTPFSRGDSGGSLGVPSNICMSPRPGGFRGHTLEILGVLTNSGGLTVREISNSLLLPTDTVKRYLYNGEIRGIFERKEGWGWKATPYGNFVLEINYLINNNNGETKGKQRGNKGETKGKLICEVKPKLVNKPQYKQQLLEIYNSLDSCAQKLWDLHTYNFSKTGSQTFVIPLETRERIKTIESKLYSPVKKVAVKELSPAPWLLKNGFTEAEAQIFWNALEKLQAEELIKYRKGKDKVTLRIYNHRIRALKEMAKYA